MAPKQDPNEIVHLQVERGGTAIYRDHAYGDRATLQVRRGDRGEVTGPVKEVNPNRLPDAGELPAA